VWTKSSWLRVMTSEELCEGENENPAHAGIRPINFVDKHLYVALKMNKHNCHHEGHLQFKIMPGDAYSNVTPRHTPIVLGTGVCNTDLNGARTDLKASVSSNMSHLYTEIGDMNSFIHSFIHSIGVCRIRRLLAVLRSFFRSSLSCSFSCHPSPPTILPSSLTSSCHLFLGQSCCSQIHI
jgi:hypothetical protein